MNKEYATDYLFRLVLFNAFRSVFLFFIDRSFCRFIMAILRLLFDRNLNARPLEFFKRPPMVVFFKVPTGKGVLLLNKLKKRFASVGSTLDTKGFVSFFCSMNDTRLDLVLFGDTTFPVT
jgi:hypothetical protein